MLSTPALPPVGLRNTSIWLVTGDPVLWVRASLSWQDCEDGGLPGETESQDTRTLSARLNDEQYLPQREIILFDEQGYKHLAFYIRSSPLRLVGVPVPVPCSIFHLLYLLCFFLGLHVVLYGYICLFSLLFPYLKRLQEYSFKLRKY